MCAQQFFIDVHSLERCLKINAALVTLYLQFSQKQMVILSIRYATGL